MEPDTTPSVAPNCHHDSKFTQIVQTMEKKQRKQGKSTEIKKKLRRLVKGNDTRKRNTTIQVKMNSNRKEKDKKDDGTYNPIGRRKEAVPDKQSEGKRNVGELGHFSDRLTRMAFFTKYK